jgi:hypothetical protein
MRINIDKAVDEAVQEISNQVKARAYRAANELRNSALFVLKGERSGRVYRVPFTKSAKIQSFSTRRTTGAKSGRLRMS